MDSDRFQLVEELFHLARKLEGANRDALLTERCTGEPELREQVERMLAFDRSTADFQPIPAPRRPPTEDASPASIQFDGDALTDPELVATGGMGEVFSARDRSLRRSVAVKVLRRDLARLGGGEAADRLMAEAELTGQLEHPGIVPVHSRGTDAIGRPFFTMKLVGGHPLSQAMPEMSMPERLRAFAQVCEAVIFAHSKDVIHRDLKPQNIMIGRFGEVLVMDWGIAKVLTPADSGTPSDGVGTSRSDTPAAATMQGTVAGTLPYLAPEQARGAIDAQDRRTDVYALGVILYELCVGAPPSARDGSPLTLDSVARGDYLGPRQKNRRVPTELDAVISKAMATAPNDRHADVERLADEVNAYLDGGLRDTFQDTLVKRWWKRARKHRVVSAVLLVLAVGVPLYAVRIQAERQRANLEAARANAAEEQQVERRREAEDALTWSRFDEARSLVDAGKLREAAGRLDELEGIDTRRAVPAIGLEALRITLRRRGLGGEILTMHGHEGKVRSVAFLGDDRRIVSGGDDGTVRLWDARAGNSLASVELDGGPGVTTVIATADGQNVFIGDRRGGVHVWDLGPRASLLSRDRSQRPVTALATAQDGSRLLVVYSFADSDPATLEIYRLAGTSVEIQTTLRFPPTVKPTSVDLAPDGRLAVLGGGEPAFGAAYLVELDGELDYREIALGHTNAVRQVRFTPDSRAIMTASEDRTARLWDVETGELLRTFRGHGRGLKAAALAPNGRSLATASYDLTLRLWNVATGSETQRLIAHTQQISSIAFSHDGRVMVTASWDGTLQLWPAFPLQAPEYPSSFRSGTFITVTADSRRALVGRTAGEIELIDLETGRILERLDGHQNPLSAISVSPDGRVAVSGDAGGVVKFWYLVDGRARESPLRHAGGVQEVTFRADGEVVWTGGRDGWRAQWSVANGQLIDRERLPFGPVTNYIPAPEGTRTLTIRGTGTDSVAEMWDLANGRRLWMHPHRDEWKSVSFDASGQRLLLRTYSSATTHLLDARTGQMLSRFGGAGWDSSPTALDGGARFVEGGRVAVMPSGSGTVFYDLERGREVTTVENDNLPHGILLRLPGSALVAVGRREGSWLDALDLVTTRRRRELARRVDDARRILAASPGDAPALAVLGQHYADRALPGRALELSLEAERGGAEVDPALLGRLHWQLDQPRRAVSQFVTALAATVDDAERVHLRLCLTAARREADARAAEAGH